MKSNCDRRERRTMKLANGILGMALALTLGGLSAWAQPATAVSAKPDSDSVRTFYLTNVVSDSHDGNEILTAVRNILSPSAKVYFVPGQNAILVRTTADQIALTEKIIKDLDRPKKTYRLTYTFTEMDGGKSIGTQHFAMIVVSGERTTLKQGSKVPVVTGSYDSGKSGTQTQMTFIDVGLNFDVSLDESVNGVRLRSKVEQSSVAEQPSGVGAQDPIIRQTVLAGTSFLTPGKPLVLGSLDIPGSTRRLDVSVMMEQVK
jgi:type II secretory pathway component GspD/PulD (secretin)